MRCIGFLIIILLVLVFSCTSESQNNSTAKQSSASGAFMDNGFMGDDVVVYGDNEFLSEKSKGYVIVYAPTLANRSVFDYKLHLLGMYNYFEKHSNPKVETILVSSDNQSDFNQFLEFAKTNYGDWYEELTIVHDKSSQLINLFEIDTIHLDHAGTAITYNSGGEELFRDEEYKCQGEKLLRMHQHFYPKSINLNTSETQVKVGQNIPDSWKKHVGAYLGKQNVLITFYPAPLSHSCSIQMETLGAIGLRYLESKDLKVVAVSIGDVPTVAAWEMHQSTAGLGLLPDTSGQISNDFNSIIKDEFGTIYSARTVFLINKQGVITYINKDYDVSASLDDLEDAIVEL